MELKQAFKIDWTDFEQVNKFMALERAVFGDTVTDTYSVRPPTYTETLRFNIQNESLIRRLASENRSILRRVKAGLDFYKQSGCVDFAGQIIECFDEEVAIELILASYRVLDDYEDIKRALVHQESAIALIEKSRRTDEVPIEYIKAVPFSVILQRYQIEDSRQMIKCPIHGEKTGSMRLYRGSNSFYCFGCGKGGTVIDFVMALEKCDFKQAVLVLKQLL